MTEVGSVVERYYAVVADRHGSADALRALLHADVRIVEHPNAINRGERCATETRPRPAMWRESDCWSSRPSMSTSFVSGSRVAVRATWQGTLARELGPLPAGTAMKAHIAGLLSVVDGQIREHETFDCYEPLVRGA